MRVADRLELALVRLRKKQQEHRSDQNDQRSRGHHAAQLLHADVALKACGASEGRTSLRCVARSIDLRTC